MASSLMEAMIGRIISPTAIEPAAALKMNTRSSPKIGRSRSGVMNWRAKKPTTTVGMPARTSSVGFSTPRTGGPGRPREEADQARLAEELNRVDQQHGHDADRDRDRQDRTHEQAVDDQPLTGPRPAPGDAQRWRRGGQWIPFGWKPPAGTGGRRRRVASSAEVVGRSAGQERLQLLQALRVVLLGGGDVADVGDQLRRLLQVELHVLLDLGPLERVLLDVDEQRPGQRVLAGGDRLGGGLDARGALLGDLDVLQAFLVVLEVGVAEVAPRVGLALDALH